MKIKAAALSALLCATALASPLTAQTVDRPIAPIATSSGQLAGKVLPSGVRAWFGVPFANPPTQDLRWKPPQPISWTGVWNADRMMPECVQVLRNHNINHYFGEEAVGENCLYMNVWAPPTATATSKLPVIVFLYGGGSTVGSSGMASYGGETVAQRGAVFVNFNYRLGILGFMAHPELSREQGGHSGNYAYLDQNAALKWINANIERFGGDPTKVVIMGQSAGAGSVIQQTFSPLSKGLFRGAVMSSGCNWGNPNPTTLAQAEQVGLDVQRRLGAASLAEMRYASADKLLAMQQENQLGVSVQGIRVGGIVDGYFMPKTQMEILRAHEINDVPIIASFNKDEAASALSDAKTVAEYNDTARRMFGAAADEFLQLYPVTADAQIREVAGRAAREAGLERNARNCAQLQAQYNRSPAYINMYSRKHPYTPGVQIADQDTATIGAYHTADIPYWYGTFDAFNIFRPTRNWTAYDRDLSEKMTASLIAFANTGNPATPAVPWPAWSAASEKKMEFGDQIRVVDLAARQADFFTAHPPAPAPRAAPPRPGPRD